MATFYADEQFSLKTTQHLRTLGHDVLTVQEAEMRIGVFPTTKS